MNVLPLNLYKEALRSRIYVDAGRQMVVCFFWSHEPVCACPKEEIRHYFTQTARFRVLFCGYEAMAAWATVTARFLGRAKPPLLLISFAW